MMAQLVVVEASWCREDSVDNLSVIELLVWQPRNLITLLHSCLPTVPEMRGPSSLLNV